MKKLILLLLIALSVALLHAQTDTNNKPLTNEEFFTKAELVFEGQQLHVVATYDINGNRNLDDIYSVYAYKVHKVYKGDQSLTGKILYSVGKRGTLGIEKFYNYHTHISNKEDEFAWYDYQNISYDIPDILWENDCENCFNENTISIYFFTASDFPEIGIPSEFAHHKKYKLLRPIADALYVCGNKILGLNNLVFHNREDFYSYMRQFKGFTVPELEPKTEKH
jgi:hypothetical protein